MIIFGYPLKVCRDEYSPKSNDLAFTASPILRPKPISTDRACVDLALRRETARRLGMSFSNGCPHTDESPLPGESPETTAYAF